MLNKYDLIVFFYLIYIINNIIKKIINKLILDNINLLKDFLIVLKMPNICNKIEHPKNDI